MFDIDVPMLGGKGEIAIGVGNPHLNLYRLCTWVSTTRLKFALVSAGSALSWFKDSIGILLPFLMHFMTSAA